MDYTATALTGNIIFLLTLGRLGALSEGLYHGRVLPMKRGLCCILKGLCYISKWVVLHFKEGCAAFQRGLCCFFLQHMRKMKNVVLLYFQLRSLEPSL